MIIVDNFDTMKYLTIAGNNGEVAKELIRISNEYGIPLITSIYPYNNIAELENAIREKHMLGY